GTDVNPKDLRSKGKCLYVPPNKDPNTYIFRDRSGGYWTPDALSDAFDGVARDAGIKYIAEDEESLSFNCTRRNAHISFLDAEMSELECTVQMDGHAGKKHKNYFDKEKGVYLKSIQNKLDRYVLKIHVNDDKGARELDRAGRPKLEGLTLEEAMYSFFGKQL